MKWTHVLAIGIANQIPDAKRFCFETLNTLFDPVENCCHLISGPDIKKLSRQVNGNYVLLVGLTKRPERAEIIRWSKAVGGNSHQLMVAKNLWNVSTNRFTVNGVTPNVQRLPLKVQEQVLWDLAITDNFRKRTAQRHPATVAHLYDQLGWHVDAVDSSRNELNIYTHYDASVTIDEEVLPDGLVSIGRHRNFSGLLIPVTP